MDSPGPFERLPGDITDARIPEKQPRGKGALGASRRLREVSRRSAAGSGAKMKRYSTVTLFARLRGLSTAQPRSTAAWYANSWSGTTFRMGWNGSGTSGT